MTCGSTKTTCQRDFILDVLQLKPVTTLELRKLGIMHPGGRVRELRKRGFPIATAWIKETDGAGILHRVARYYLASQNRGGQ
ncbi:MAG: transcriptional regulator [Magnetococcales bacterium]|nr:transcriptional regulator [Magnetococcales bacterium]